MDLPLLERQSQNSEKNSSSFVELVENPEHVSLSVASLPIMKEKIVLRWILEKLWMTFAQLGRIQMEKFETKFDQYFIVFGINV